MCDIETVHKFFSLCHENMKIIIVGDKHQLPSVGYGEFLLDVIKGGIPMSYLTRNFRFERLVELAEAIKSGKLMSKLSLLNDSDTLTFIDKDRCRSVDVAVYDIYERHKNDEIQIIAPWNKVVENWNKNIHNKLVEEQGRQAPHFYIKGEKLVGLKNYYAELNGLRKLVLSKGQQCRYVCGNEFIKVALEDGTIVEVPRRYVDLAHCVDVHKSQGDEWDYVVVIIDRYSSFVCRELFYTASTRPKKHLYIISTLDIIKKCIENERTPRLTMLQWILKKKITQL